MLKIRVYFFNQANFHDEKLFVDILLPAVPRKGEMVRLSERHHEILAEKLGKDLDHAGDYLHYFYGASHDIEVVKKGNLKDLCFTDAKYVTDVSYDTDDDFVSIELYTQEEVDLG